MANTTAPMRGAEPPLLELEEEDVVGADEEGPDLEAYLDLEESAEIARLMQQVRDGADIGPVAPAAAPELSRCAKPEAQRELPPPPTSRLRRPDESLDAARLSSSPDQATGAGRAEAPEPAADPAAAARRSAAPRPGRLQPLDVEAVARALGEVQVQGRQLVVGCPACGGRPTIVIYANRFKCFGCEAAGDEAALAAHLTGWDARRVARWLASAAPAAAADDEAEAGRRPWRLPFFAR